MVKDITKVRQLVGRFATKYTPGGRQKRQIRPIPSMPKLRCLEEDKAHEPTSLKLRKVFFVGT